MADPRQLSVTVAPLSAGQHDDAIAALARAFWPDPLFGFFVKDRLAEHHALPAVFDAFMRDARPFERTWTASITEAGRERVVGAAVWLPPGTMPRPMRRELALQLRIGRILLRGRHRLMAMRLLDAVDKVHPHEPHWYLFLLGTDPALQGRGIGADLLAPGLEAADAEGVACYLETQKERNLPFYGRFGFEVTNTVSVPGSPTVWCMQRPPR